MVSEVAITHARPESPEGRSITSFPPEDEESIGMVGRGLFRAENWDIAAEESWPEDIRTEPKSKSVQRGIRGRVAETQARAAEAYE